MFYHKGQEDDLCPWVLKFKGKSLDITTRVIFESLGSTEVADVNLKVMVE